MRRTSSAVLALCSILVLVVTLNLRGGGGWVVASAHFPDDSAIDVDGGSVWLETVEASWTRVTKSRLMAFFDRSAVVEYLESLNAGPGAEVELCVYCYSDVAVSECPTCGAAVPPGVDTCPECGESLPVQFAFWGCDTIRVIGSGE
jgi:hypothetical protein